MKPRDAIGEAPPPSFPRGITPRPEYAAQNRAPGAEERKLQGAEVGSGAGGRGSVRSSTSHYRDAWRARGTEELPPRLSRRAASLRRHIGGRAPSNRASRKGSAAHAPFRFSVHLGF